MRDSRPRPPQGLLEAALYTRDLASAECFYRDVLGLTVIATQPGRHVFFRCGRGVLLVFNPEATRSEVIHIGDTAVPAHGTEGAGHVAFAVPASAIDRWREQLRRAGVAIETEIAWPHGGHSLYFRDPAGNSVELATPSIWPHLARQRLGPPAR